MSAKEILLEVAENLPPDATLNDVIYELEFRQAVQQGLNELDRGEGIPIEHLLVPLRLSSQTFSTRASIVNRKS